jgi:hypothetical protein
MRFIKTQGDILMPLEDIEKIFIGDMKEGDTKAYLIAMYQKCPVLLATKEIRHASSELTDTSAVPSIIEWIEEIERIEL